MLSLLVVVHGGPRGAAAALLVRVRVLEARRLLQLACLFLRGKKKQTVAARSKSLSQKREPTDETEEEKKNCFKSCE